MQMTRSQSGFSLIELLVVLAILGLLAGLVVSNILERLHKARYETAISQVVLIQGKIAEFAMDNGRLSTSIRELVEKPGDARFWIGPYIKQALLTDPWGNNWNYTAEGNLPSFELTSFGEDGAAGGEGYAQRHHRRLRRHDYGV